MWKDELLIFFLLVMIIILLRHGVRAKRPQGGESGLGSEQKDHKGGKAISGSHQTVRNLRSSHMDNSVTRQVAN